MPPVAPAGDTDGFFNKRLVYQVAGEEHVRVRRDLTYKNDPRLTFGLYSPDPIGARHPTPVVVLVHGDASPEVLADANDWGTFVSAGQLLAASGLAAVAFNHRSSQGRTRLMDAAGDIEDLIRHVRDNHTDLGVDPDRLGLWSFSMAAPLCLPMIFANQPPFVRCIAVFYGALNLLSLRDQTAAEVPDETLRQFSPLECLPAKPHSVPPMLIARAGREERPWLNPTMDRFIEAALARNLELDVFNHATGRHSFDVLDDNERSREILASTVGFLVRNLG